MNFKSIVFLYTLLLIYCVILKSQGQQDTRFRNKKLKRSLPRIINYHTNGTRENLDDDTFVYSGKILRLSESYYIDYSQNSRWTEEPYKFVYLLATEKIYIDQDVVDNITLIIIAPTWEIVGNRTIILDGKEGKAYDSLQAENGNITTNKNGLDGKSGEDATKPGNFYGVGKTFINGENLFISANGGNGGNGQNGGDGVNGLDAYTFNFKNSLNSLNSKFYRVHVEKISDFRPPGINSIHYRIDSISGTGGGRGGNGGNAGKGSEKGEIKIIELVSTNKSLIRTSAIDGLDGRVGLGGKGGKGGKQGKTVRIISYNFQSWQYFGTPEETDKGYVENGEDGKNGTNPVESSHLKQEVLVNFFSRALNKFYKNVRLIFQSKNNHQDSNELIDFQQLLDSSEDILKVYDVTGLTDMLLSLEEDYNSIFHSKPFTHVPIPYYESLRSKVEYCLKNLEKNEKSKKFAKILQELSEVVRKRILTITAQESNTTIHLYEERGNVSTSLANMTQHLQFNHDWKMVQRLINKKSGWQYVLNRFPSIREKLDSKIEWLVHNYESIERNSYRNDIIMSSLRAEMYHYNHLALRQMYNMIKLITLSRTLDNNLGIKHRFNDTKKLKMIIPEDVIKSIQDTDEKYNDYINSRVHIIKSHLHFIEMKKIALNTNSTTWILDLISTKLNKLLSDFQKVPRQNGNILFKEEKIFINAKQEWSNTFSEGTVDQKDNERILNFINLLKIHSRVAQITGSSYKKFAIDIMKVNLIDNAISTNQDDFITFQTKQEEIYKSWNPLLNAIMIGKKTMNDVELPFEPDIDSEYMWAVNSALDDLHRLFRILSYYYISMIDHSEELALNSLIKLTRQQNYILSNKIPMISDNYLYIHPTEEIQVEDNYRLNYLMAHVKLVDIINNLSQNYEKDFSEFKRTYQYEIKSKSSMDFSYNIYGIYPNKGFNWLLNHN